MRETLEISKFEGSSMNINIGNFIAFRWVLVFLGFFLYFLEAFFANGFSVALVAMVNATQPMGESQTTTDSCNSGLTRNISMTTVKTKSFDRKFNWSTSEQGIILAAYFWGFILVKLFASRILGAFGQRATNAVALACSCLLVISTPFVAPVHPYALAANRFLIGGCNGPLSSAMQSLLAAWAPRSELSSMVTTIFSGGPLGNVFGFVATSWLIESVGWETTFWIEGALGFLLLPFWIVLIRNSPQNHPWLSNHERKLLDENKHIQTRKTVPMVKILSSPYVYICILCQFAKNWVDTMIVVEGPLFFTQKIGLKLTTASYVCGGTNLASVISLLIFGRISDMLIRKKFASKILVRKLFHIIGAGGAGLMILGICFADCDSPVVITLWILVGGVLVGTACSYSVSIIDIAPNYTAFVNSLLAFGNIGASLNPTVTAVFLSQENGWNKSLYLTSGISLLSCIVYVAFMTGEVQPWNFEKEISTPKTN